MYTFLFYVTMFLSIFLIIKVYWQVDILSSFFISHQGSILYWFKTQKLLFLLQCSPLITIKIKRNNQLRKTLHFASRTKWQLTIHCFNCLMSGMGKICGKDWQKCLDSEACYRNLYLRAYEDTPAAARHPLLERDRIYRTDGT